MAIPEQTLPGDEPSDNREEESSIKKKSLDRPHTGHTLNQERLSRLRQGNRSRLAQNKNWYQTSDFGDFETTDRRRKTVDKSRDDEDLPPDDDYSVAVEDARQNPESWVEFNNADITELIQKGFENLTEEEKRQKTESLIRYNRHRAQEKSRAMRDEFRFYKDRKFFGLQIFLGYSLAIMLMVFITTFVGLFIYVTFREGMLNEAGIGVGILNTIQEIFRIIFSSTTPDF